MKTHFITEITTGAPHPRRVNDLKLLRKFLFFSVLVMGLLNSLIGYSQTMANETMALPETPPLLTYQAPWWLKNSNTGISILDDMDDKMGTPGPFQRTYQHPPSTVFPASITKIWMFWGANDLVPRTGLSSMMSDLIPGRSYRYSIRMASTYATYQHGTYSSDIFGMGMKLDEEDAPFFVQQLLTAGAPSIIFSGIFKATQTTHNLILQPYGEVDFGYRTYMFAEGTGDLELMPPSDVVPVVLMDNLNFSNAEVGVPRDFAVTIANIGNLPTDGPITFRLPKLSAFTISYSAENGTSNVYGGLPTSNSEWTITESANFITASSTTAVPAATGETYVGFKIARKPNVGKNTGQSVTCSVIANSGGELVNTNNSQSTFVKAN